MKAYYGLVGLQDPNPETPELPVDIETGGGTLASQTEKSIFDKPIDSTQLINALVPRSSSGGSRQQNQKPVQDYSAFFAPAAAALTLGAFSQNNNSSNNPDPLAGTTDPYAALGLNWNEAESYLGDDSAAYAQQVLNPTYAAQGGLMSLARGGITTLGSYSDGGRLLKGPGDGMSDNIPAMIGKKQPARLADGEFVVPADVVSHLGNGSTEAGANVLYQMMEKVRRARTGQKKQGRQINPNKFIPT
jgi:hypothetical protein